MNPYKDKNYYRSSLAYFFHEIYVFFIFFSFKILDELNNLFRILHSSENQ